MELTNEICLTVLLCVSTTVIIVIAVYSIIFIRELTLFIRNLNKATVDVHESLGPTLVEIRKTLSGFNSVTSAADKKLNSAKGAILKVLAVAGAAMFGAKGFTQSFLKGLKVGFGLVRK